MAAYGYLMAAALMAGWLLCMSIIMCWPVWLAGCSNIISGLINESIISSIISALFLSSIMTALLLIY